MAKLLSGVQAQIGGESCFWKGMRSDGTCTQFTAPCVELLTFCGAADFVLAQILKGPFNDFAVSFKT